MHELDIDAVLVRRLLAARELFRAELGVDDATWARARGGVLSQSLGALSYYTLETNAVLVDEAQLWLAEVLAESL
ncbi:MAG TPA: hypothetical protein VFT18_09020 [Gaiellaceae bacterium]|nr:hypothetical protein [Gaiellaceae bacterium]